MLPRKQLLNIKISSERVDKVYKITKDDKKLGKGNFGIVVRAEDRATGQMRAIKIIRKSKFEDAGLNVDLLANEFNLMLAMDHPNVIRLYEVYEDAKYIYFVMELMEGRNLLEAFLADRPQPSEKRLRELFFQLMKGIQYLHRNGIAHRDIKPQNIMFTDRKAERLKIIDFGVSKYFFKDVNPKEEITLRTQTGSLYYIAPEILEGKYDYKCDIWSAGVLLFMMISGAPPFFDQNPAIVVEKVRGLQYDFGKEVWGRVSPESKDLLRHMLAPESARLGADGVLAHPWMQMEMERREFDVQLNSIREFFHGSGLSRLLRELLAASCSETDAQHVGELFIELDQDGDGLIGREELLAAVRQRMKFCDDALCAEIARNFPGDKINYNSFLAAANSVAGLSNYEQRLEKVFARLDRGGQGRVTAADLAAFAAAEKVGTQREHELAERYQACIDEFDGARKGFLTLDDVKQAMKRAP